MWRIFPGEAAKLALTAGNIQIQHNINNYQVILKAQSSLRFLIYRFWCQSSASGPAA